jgi:hypothetical protein
MSDKKIQAIEGRAPLPRSDYVARVDASAINWVNAQATLSLRLVCKNKIRTCETIIEFVIHQPDPEFQRHERCRLRRMADAMGIGDDFDDSDQLHGIPFRLTVWGMSP